MEHALVLSALLLLATDYVAAAPPTDPPIVLAQRVQRVLAEVLM